MAKPEPVKYFQNVFKEIWSALYSVTAGILYWGNESEWLKKKKNIYAEPPEYRIACAAHTNLFIVPIS